VRLRNSDAEDFELDESSLLQRYEDKDVDFSLELLDVDGTHKVKADDAVAYFVLEGGGHVHLGSKIVELDHEDVVFAKESHELEGDMKLLAVRDREGEEVLWSPVED